MAQSSPIPAVTADAPTKHEVALTLSTPLDDQKLRQMPDSAIGIRVVELNAGFGYFQAIAASAGSMTVRHAVALGQLFEEAFRRWEGEFGDWLQSAVGEDPEGRPRICEQTARRYRTLWRKRDRLYPPDGSVPECRSLTEAYIKVGLIPEPERVEGEKSETPFYRLTYVSQSDAMEQWPKAELQSLIDRTEPIARDREKARQLLEAAA